MWLAILVLFICSILGAFLADPPDFAKAQKGFEPRGTPLALKANALRQLRSFPRRKYCGLVCPEGEFIKYRFRRLSDPGDEPLPSPPPARPAHPDHVIGEGHGPRRLQSALAHFDEVSEVCYRGSLGRLNIRPDIFLVLQNPEEGDLSGAGLLGDVCEAGVRLELSSAYSSRCTTVQGRCCPLLTLPRVLVLMQKVLEIEASGSTDPSAVEQFLADPRQACNDLGTVPLTSVFQRINECSAALLSGSCTRAGDFSCTSPSVAARCQAVNPLVHFFITYLVTHDWHSSSGVVATGVALPVKRLKHHMVFYESQEELPEYFSGARSLKITGIRVQDKFPLFQARLYQDVAFAMLAVTVSVTCMICHTRGFFIAMVTATQVILSMTFSYFVFRVIFQQPFFTFLNMNMAFCASAIGIDDVFVFMDAYRQSYYALALETPLENRLEWVMRRAFGTMLVTSLTTAVAFLANIMSPITVVKNFGAFASLVIMVDFGCMMVILPSAVLISEFGILKDRCRCLGAWNAPMVKVSSQNGGESKPHWLERLYDKTIFPLIANGKWVIVLVFTSLGVVAVTQALQLKSSDAEENQLLVDGHLAERFDQHWSGEFRWFGELASRSGMPVLILAGVVPSDKGDAQDPDNFGPMERAPGDLASAASQGWYLQLCRRLSSGPFYRALSGGECFWEGVHRWATGGCANLTTPCCPQAQPQSWPLASGQFHDCTREWAARSVLQSSSPSAAELLQEAERLKGRFSSPPGPGLTIDHDGTLVGVIFGYDSTQAVTSKIDRLRAYHETVESWASGVLNAPPGVPQPFWYSDKLEWYSLMQSLQDGAYASVGLALIFCMLVLLVVVGNVIMALYSLVTILMVLSLVVWSLIGCGWVLDLNTSVVLAICAGMCVDFVCHMSHAYVHTPKQHRGTEPEGPSAERFRRSRYALSTMGISVSFGALSTFLGGCSMMPAQVKFFFQFGTFLQFTMMWSFLYSMLYFPALTAIAGITGKSGDLRVLGWRCAAFCCRRKPAVATSESTNKAAVEIAIG